MSYQVLARKYRPKNFEEVVGQEHVTTSLKHAIEKNRLHHAYLFTGVRGTGKTSLARILAMALNCEDGPKVKPDPDSPNCRAIAKGQFLDVIEIDGASNTSVESIRELREQVKYLPAAGRYKIYIIDEVHMLSTSAFNALLKTLEEPPPHVVFIFATTEAHKIPITILSRCQRFDLRRLSRQQIRDRLQHICKQEKVSFDSASLDLLARAAEGSMRDGQSLLDMAIGLCGDKMQVGPIREMLGLAQANWIEDLTQDCLQGKISEALAKVEEIYGRGYDLRQIALQWVAYLHDLTLLKAAGRGSLDEALTEDKMKTMEAVIAGVALPDLQVAAQTVYRAAEQIFRSESPKILFDLLVVKLVHGTPYQSLGALLNAGEKPPPEGVSGGRPHHSKTMPESPKESGKKSIRETRAGPWGKDLLDRALKHLPQIKAVLDNAHSCHWEGNQFVVGFEPGSMWMEMFQEKKGRLAEALEKETGSPVKVLIREEKKDSKPLVLPEEDSGPSLPDDPVVRQAVDILNATVKEIKKF